MEKSKRVPKFRPESMSGVDLRVLTRTDRCIEAIVKTASHVVVYRFDVGNGKWIRKGVEGAMFVVQRTVEPQFQLIVMNKPGSVNFVENVEDIILAAEETYLLYLRRSSGVTYGIWFCEPSEFREIHTLVRSLCSVLSESPTKPQSTSSMSSVIGYREHEKDGKNPSMVEQVGNLEASPITPTTSDVKADASFWNFFNAAVKIGVHPSNIKVPADFATPTSSPSKIYSRSHIFTPDSSTPVQSGSTPSQGSSKSSNDIPKLFTPSDLLSPAFSPTVPPISSSTALNTSPNLQGSHSVSTQQQQQQQSLALPPSYVVTDHSPIAQSGGPIISKDLTGRALLRLLQDDRFIDMFCDALKESAS